jgi:hypothetical protein
VVDADRKGRSRSGELIVGYRLEEPMVIRPNGRCRPQGSKPIKRTDRCRPDGPMRVSRKGKAARADQKDAWAVQ